MTITPPSMDTYIDPMPGCVVRLVEHTTRYRYSTAVESSYHVAILEPLSSVCKAKGGNWHFAQTLEHFVLAIQPQPSGQSRTCDSFGNFLHRFQISKPYKRLTVHTASRVVINTSSKVAATDMTERLRQTPPWEALKQCLRFVKGQNFDPAVMFSFPSPEIPYRESLRAYAQLEFWPARPVGQAAFALMHRIYREFTYQSGSTSVNTSVDEVMASRMGVCQDFSHVMIGALRALGLAACYVSGYMLTRAAEGKEKLIGADASHAWISIWTGSAGWLDLDPTNDCIPDERYVTVARGRDYADVSPLKGIIRGGMDHELIVAVTVN